MISKEVVNEIRRRWRELYPADKRGGIICPRCGSGGGKNGTGISENPKSANVGALKCFGCDFSGDVIELRMRELGLTGKGAFRTVAEELAGRLGIPLEPSKKKGTAVPFKAAPSAASDPSSKGKGAAPAAPFSSGAATAQTFKGSDAPAIPFNTDPSAASSFDRKGKSAPAPIPFNAGTAAVSDPSSKGKSAPPKASISDHTDAASFSSDAAPASSSSGDAAPPAIPFNADAAAVSDPSSKGKSAPPKASTSDHASAAEPDFSSYFSECGLRLNQTDYWRRRGLSEATCRHFNAGFDPKWRHHDKPGKRRPDARFIIPTSAQSYLARSIVDVGNYSKIKCGKVHIFNEVALAQHDVVIAVEGEIDAMSIYEAGYENVIGLGSMVNDRILLSALEAARVKPEVIILSLDNEQKPHVRARHETIASRLREAGFRVVDGTSIAAPKKDANELLCSDRARLKSNIEGLMSLARAAQAGQAGLKCPQTFIVPKQFELDERGVHYGGRTICFTPIIPVKTIVSAETGSYKYVLSAKINGRWEELDAVPGRTCLDHNRVMELADRGVRVTAGNNSKALVEYFNRAINENEGRMEVLTEVSKPGWTEDHSNFILPSTSNFYMPKLAPVYSQSGKFEEWLKQAAEIRDYDSPIARIMLDTAFAAPLLEPLNIRTFSLYLGGNSLSGKTTSQLFAASVWGNPRLMSRSFNATTNGLEQAALQANNLPLLIDEKQAAAANCPFQKLIYDLSGEGDKTRAYAKQGEIGLRQRKYWRTVGMMTGEDKLLLGNSKAGAGTRVIEIILGLGEKIFPSADAANSVHRFILKQHGTAGIKFLEPLLEDAKYDFPMLRGIFDVIWSGGDEDHKVWEGANSYTDRYLYDHVLDAAAIATADYLSSFKLFGVSEEKAQEQAISRVFLPLTAYMTAREELMDYKRAWRYLCTEIMRRRYHFEGEHLRFNDKDTRPQSPVYGKFDCDAKNGEWKMKRVIISRSNAISLLEDGGFSGERMISDFITAGKVPRDPNRKGLPVQRPSSGTKSVPVLIIERDKMPDEILAVEAE